MHLLYKVCRADNPQALCSDFKSVFNVEKRSHEVVQADAANDMNLFLLNTNDVNRQLPEKNGATRLWLAAEQGHVEAAREIIQHPQIDPNKVRLSSKTTPLFIAAYYGHDAVVATILSHADVDVNLGSMDTGASPLFMAAQEGREGVVEILLGHRHINVNEATRKGVTPLCKAAQLGQEHVVKILLATGDINVNHVAEDGTAASTATAHGHLAIIEMLEAHSVRAAVSSSTPESF